jgi:hypothetical protein
MWWQVALRVIGYALTAVVAPLLASKRPELGAAAGTVGGVLLNKATTQIVPRRPQPLFPTETTPTSELETPNDLGPRK